MIVSKNYFKKYLNRVGVSDETLTRFHQHMINSHMSYTIVSATNISDFKQGDVPKKTSITSLPTKRSGMGSVRSSNVSVMGMVERTDAIVGSRGKCTGSFLNQNGFSSNRFNQSDYRRGGRRDDRFDCNRGCYRNDAPYRESRGYRYDDDRFGRRGKRVGRDDVRDYVVPERRNAERPPVRRPKAIMKSKPRVELPEEVGESNLEVLSVHPLSIDDVYEAFAEFIIYQENLAEVAYNKWKNAREEQIREMARIQRMQEKQDEQDSFINAQQQKQTFEDKKKAKKERRRLRVESRGSITA